MSVETLMLMVLVLTVLVGLYIAYRVSSETKLTVRLILLLPLFSAVINLQLLCVDHYAITIMSIIRDSSMLVFYILIGLLLRGKRLLKNIDTICEREII